MAHDFSYIVTVIRIRIWNIKLIFLQKSVIQIAFPGLQKMLNALTMIGYNEILIRHHLSYLENTPLLEMSCKSGSFYYFSNDIKILFEEMKVTQMNEDIFEPFRIIPTQFIGNDCSTNI